jgi:hypothetical protein
VKPFLKINLIDYNEENLRIEGLNPKWYAKTLFIYTPYNAKGIYAYLEFLEKNENIILSPSR